MAQTVNAPQNLVAGVQNMNINDETPLMAAAQPSPQAEYPITSPPPFLSGVPMVNPGSYTGPGTNAGGSQQPQAQQIISSQQPPSQTQSVVSNMAAYSSS